MKTTHLRKLLTAVVCLFAALSAQAQFSGTVNQVPRNDWAPEAAAFPIGDVAQALGTDASTLLGALDSWIAEGSTDPNMFFYAAPSAPDTWTDAYGTGGEKGFWIGEDGELIAYPNGAYYANPVWDEEEAVFAINIGMMPDVLKYGIYNRMLHFALKYGEKMATFDIDLTVTGGEEVEIPEPATLLWKELNIVDELTVDVEQKPFSNWGASEVQVDLSEVIAKLGITNTSVLTNELAKLLYATEYFLGDDVALGAMKSDTLTNEASAGGIGFWLRAYDNQDEEAPLECCRAPYDGSDYFYVENFGYDAESGMLTCNMGQMPNKLEGGKQYFTVLYLIYGDKAVSIRYNLNVQLIERGNINDFTIVGETEAIVSQMPTTGYEAKSVRVKIADIAAALECEEEDIELAALKDELDFGGSTANNGGFWFNSESLVCSHGSGSSMYVEPQTDGNLSVLNVGQYPGYFTDLGQEQTVKLYFLNTANHKAYVLSITLRIEEETVPQGEFRSVAQRTLSFQQVPAGYSWTQPGYDIPQEWIAENIGTDDWVLYGQDQLDAEGNEKQGNSKYTTNYTMGEKPGFWFDRDGRVIGWGDGNSVFGMTAGGFTAGKIQMIQMDGGACQVGDVFTAKVFFVNEENGRMVTVNLIYNIVEEVVEYKNVGTEDIMIPVAEDDQVIDIDLTKAAEALGVTTEYLLDMDNTPLCGMTEGGIFGTGQSCDMGLGFNKDGYFDQVGALVLFSIDEESKLNAFSTEPVADDFTLSTQFCFQVGDKQYVFNVKFVSTAIYSGIQNVAADRQADGRLFDLSGRQVVNPVRGIYIQNGRKVVK